MKVEITSLILHDEESLPPFEVFCDMTGYNGVGVTVISQDSENRTHVIGYHDAPGSYSRLRQLASLTTGSSHSSSSMSVIVQDCLKMEWAGRFYVILLR